LTSFFAAHGHEVHQGHEAIHKMELRRSPRSPQYLSRGDTMQVEVDYDTMRLINITTQLDDMKSEYTGMIGVGTTSGGDAQFHARVVFDTGSTNLWVASHLCQAYPCNSTTTETYYNPSKSQTSEKYSMTASHELDIMFGTGELRGPLTIDTYRVGPMEVKKQPFAMIREMSGDVFSSFHFEGILGLAFPSLSFGGITPFFDRVIEQKLLEKNEFAFYLNIDSSQPSALLWGGIDKDLYLGDIRMFPVAQEHYWALDLVDFRIGGESLVRSSPNDPTDVPKLIIDSGTTYFTAPSILYEKITSKLPDASCKDVESYKPMSYVLRDANNETYQLDIGQEVYMIGSEYTGCKSAFMQLDVKKTYGPAMILGEVFMRHFFTVFDRGDGKPGSAKIGIARAKIGAQPKVSSLLSSLVQPHVQEVSPYGILRREGV